jgi:glucose/arabinose dehydrogenase
MTYRLSVRFLTLVTLAAGITQTSAAQAPQQEFVVEPPLLDRPLIFDSSTRASSGNKIPGPKFRVVPMLGLSHPYALAFLPNGNMLITERAGRLRIVRDGKLDPQPISGIPDVLNTQLRGMNDLALHPHYAENHWIYFTYYKPVPGTTNAKATLARARYDGGHELGEVRDIFSTDSVVSGPSSPFLAVRTIP